MFLLLSLKNPIAEKKHVAMQKLFIKKEKKDEKKWTSVRDIENNGYLDARHEKKRKERKIAHVFLQKVFQVSSKRDTCFQGA